MTGFHDQAPITIAGAFTFGMLLSLFSSARRALVDWLKLSEEQTRGLLSVLVLALVPASIAAGVLTDVWGAKQVLCLGSIVAALSLVVLLSTGNARVTVWAMVLAAVGAALLNCGSTVLMPHAFF
jgi:Na+/melibiose symporter-like transporter